MTARGGKRDGAGRKPGAKTKTGAKLRQAAQAHTGDALSTLAAIMKDKDQPAAARVAAANGILDRGHGKPTQALDIDANVKAAVSVIERRIVRPHASNPDR